MKRLPALTFGIFLAFLAGAQVTTNPTVTGRGTNLATQVTGTLSPANGGTGVANNAAATLTRSGSHALTITTTGTTGVTLPTSGTIYSNAADIPLTGIAQIATNTVAGNATNATADITALAVGSCSTSGSALTWTTNTGFGCNTAIAASTATTATTATDTASKTGTGSTYATNTSPVFTTPTLGVASATSINFGGTALSVYVEGTCTLNVAGDATGVIATQTCTRTVIGRMTCVRMVFTVGTNFTDNAIGVAGAANVTGTAMSVLSTTAGAAGGFLAAGPDDGSWHMWNTSQINGAKFIPLTTHGTIESRVCYNM